MLHLVFPPVFSQFPFRYVQLEDCKHVFAVCDLDHWISVGADEDPNKGSLNVKKCPKCSTTIRTSRRYNNALKSAYDDVIRVKEIMYGKEKPTRMLLCRLAVRLETQASDDLNSLSFFSKYMSQQIYKRQFNPFFNADLSREARQSEKRFNSVRALESLR